MAVINVDDIYILDNTGQQVDDAVDYGLFNSNPNLLDNAYFVGGGSQLGDGVFPINQKGKTSYPGGSAFDRWVSDATITLTASGLQATAITFQNQSKEFFDFLLGKTVTYSILTAGGTVKQATIQFPSAYPSSVYIQEVFNDGVHSIAFALFPAGNGQVVRLLGADIAAAKLEIGSYSTIANDVPPDFGAELAKCQRSLFRVSPMGTSQRGYAGFGSANSSKNILVFVPTPATLAAQPTVSFSNCNAYNYVTSGSIAISSISIDSWTQNGVFLSCTPSDASQVVQYQPYVLRVAQGGYLQIACEL